MFGLPRGGPALIRRDFIRMSAGALGVLLVEGCAPRRAAARQEPISWEEFERELLPRAEALLAERMDEEAYVAEVAARVRQVAPDAIPTRDALPRHRDFLVTMFDLPEGDGFPWHDHRRYNGVILVLEGGVAIRNADVVGDDREPPAGRAIRIRETQSGRFEPGQASTLTSVRDNIHDVRGAAGGGRVLDIFTWMGPNPGSVYLEVDEGSGVGDRVYEARFVR